MDARMGRWKGRLEQAGDDPEALRTLLHELVRARVRSLTDMVAQRQATWAVVQVLHRLGDADKAQHAAREWLQLADSPPVASDDEVKTVRAWLRSEGVQAPKKRLPRVSGRRERRERPRRSGRAEAKAPRQAPLDAAREAGVDARWGDAFKAVRKQRGPEAQAVRVWLHVAKALSLEGEAREAQLRDTESWLRKQANVPAAAAPEAAPTSDDPVEVLLGRPLPRKRSAAVRVVERFVAETPDRADAMASTVVRTHVAGDDRGAPWWLTAITLALAVSGGAQTREALAALEGRAAAPYVDPSFEVAITAAKAVIEGGYRLTSVRQGAMREEPEDRQVWTVRFAGADGAERQLALAPKTDEPSPEGLPAMLASRLLHLCPSTVLFADGSGDRALVDACAEVGIAAITGGSPAVAVAAVAAQQPATPPDKPEAPKAAAPKAPPAPKGPSPVDLLRTALEQGADEEQVAELMKEVRRRRTVQRVIEDVWPGLDDEPVARCARAATVAWPGDRPLPEFTTLLVRAAARGGAASRALLTSDPLAERLGGVGIDRLIDVLVPVVASGWQIDRVLRGSTRRERDSNPLVEVASDALMALWRGVVVNGDLRCELWAVTALTAEARAAVPHLLLEDRQRVVVLPLDPELLDWYGSVAGPEPVGWTGDEAGEAVVAALGALTPSA